MVRKMAKYVLDMASSFVLGVWSLFIWVWTMILSGGIPDKNFSDGMLNDTCIYHYFHCGSQCQYPENETPLLYNHFLQ